MKLITKFSLILSIIVCSTNISNAQSFLDRVKKKAKEKIEERVDEKVDEEIDKGFDKLENSLDSMTNTGAENSESTNIGQSALQSRMSSLMGSMGMSGEPVPIEDKYVFKQLVQMHIEMYDSEENQTSNGEFITHLNPETGNLAYEVVSDDFNDNDQGLFIMDLQNKAMIMLNNKDGEKTGIVYGMGTFFEDIQDVEVDEEYEEEDMPDMEYLHPEIKKTGKTKNISGFKCEQFVYDTEEVESEFWITDELKTSEKDFFSTLFKTSAVTHGMGYGYVMESTTKDKETGNVNKMQVTRVDNNANSSFELSAFEITNLGSFSMPAGVD